jgi:Domain of unknown function (DUF4262)
MVSACHCLVCSGQAAAADPVAADVARWGWHVRVQPGGTGFTIGLWHAFRHAELAMFGLAPAEVAAWLETAAAEVATGRVVCPDGRPDDILGGLVVSPRPVLAGWHRHLFGDALRFYRGQPVPIVQFVWGGDEPRLWERRPDPPPPADWRFPVSPDALVLTTAAIAFGGAPVSGIVHDEDGEWQFLDGPEAFGELTIVHLAHVAATHPGVAAAADLPAGWEAWRDSGGGWRRSPLEPEPDHE